jgi:putative oxygen-independent coproporphyrinogen III oxidase
LTGGIYVHFPYCEHRCSYCDFVVATPRHIPQARFTDAIIAELESRAFELSGPADSLYLGGGTPSLWEADQLKRVVAAVVRRPGLSADAEVTLEANPSEVNRESMRRLRALGITRVSLGVQSFQDDLLLAIERRHDGAEATEACRTIAEVGFESHSVDLIFGLPGQTVSRWQDDLTAVLELKPPHLSVYGLTIEPRTMMRRQVERGIVQVPGDAEQVEMMFAARDRLREAGYTHYEVSSYALPGHRARHNSSYWQGAAYLGIGPGAHGFIPPRRWVNVRRPSRYIEAALSGDPTETTEQLDDATLSFERIMTGLRDLEHGVDFGADWERYASAAQRHVEQGHLELHGRRARLTDSGLRLMNRVLLDLL